MLRNRFIDALRDAEYDLMDKKENSLATDAWMLKRKLERNADYVPNQIERCSLSDMEDLVINDLPLRELRRRR